MRLQCWRRLCWKSNAAALADKAEPAALHLPDNSSRGGTLMPDAPRPSPRHPSCPPRARRMPSHKRLKTKITLAKKMKQNRPIPQWIRLRTDNKIRCAAARSRAAASRPARSATYARRRSHRSPHPSRAQVQHEAEALAPHQARPVKPHGPAGHVRGQQRVAGCSGSRSATRTRCTASVTNRHSSNRGFVRITTPAISRRALHSHGPLPPVSRRVSVGSRHVRKRYSKTSRRGAHIPIIGRMAYRP